MARQYQKRRSNRGQNLQSAGWDVLQFAGRTVEKAATGLAHWATTDHFGFGQMFQNMPTKGFLDSIRHTSIIFRLASIFFLIQLVRIIVWAALMGLLIGVGIPFLITILLGG